MNTGAFPGWRATEALKVAASRLNTVAVYEVPPQFLDGLVESDNSSAQATAL